MLLLSSGCMVGPDYVTPEAEVNADWVEGADARALTGETAEIEWWKNFNDPVLDSLIEEAYRQNLSLRVAAVRVLQAMAQRGIAVGELFPQTQAISGSFTREKLSEHPPTPVRYVNDRSLGFDAAWELDLWGKGPRQNEFVLSRPAWESDSIDAIEREPEHNRQYLRILAIEQRSKMAPGWDAKVGSYFVASPKYRRASWPRERRVHRHGHGC